MKFILVRSGFAWLFWLNIIYFIVGMVNIVYHFTNLEYIQMIWMSLMSVPIWLKPLGRYLNMRV
jgi:hypothetical protein